jgi:hypothetical protein
MSEFVPDDFAPPDGLSTPQFRLEPLGPEHNELDHKAWASSMEHIHATPGWQNSRWPHEMTADENLDDLRRHRRDFESRTGFTYTVLEPATDDVIGCVYIYPLKTGEPGAKVSSWVTARRAELDIPLHSAVSDWLARDWPFQLVEYAAR